MNNVWGLVGTNQSSLRNNRRHRNRAFTTTSSCHRITSSDPLSCHSRRDQPASERLTTSDALTYLREVKTRFANNRKVYDRCVTEHVSSPSHRRHQSYRAHDSMKPSPLFFFWPLPFLSFLTLLFSKEATTITTLSLGCIPLVRIALLLLTSPRHSSSVFFFLDFGVDASLCHFPSFFYLVP